MLLFKGRMTLAQAIGSAVIGVAMGVYIFKPYFQTIKTQHDLESGTQDTSSKKERSKDNS